MKLQRQATQIWIQNAQAFLNQYQWLTDSYVLDFYCGNHWEKLPSSWRNFLLEMGPEELGRWLDVSPNANHFAGKSICPLSLLCFKAAVKLLSLNRNPTDTNSQRGNMKSVSSNDHEPNMELANLFNKHVKLKKRHEIFNISNIIRNLCGATKTGSVLDVGAGLGHLSRYLSYAYSLKLTCVDCVQNFGSSASKFDKELQSYMAKKKEGRQVGPTHKCLKLEMDTHDMYLQHLDTKFGIIGLHTCGNLAPVILHNFVNSPAKFFVSVGCCYMKMDSKGFPLSDFGKKGSLQVSYEGLEVACHAIEQYSKRLKEGFASKLLTHCYRATLETILVAKFGIKKAGLKGVPHSDKLSFPEYGRRAVASLDISLSDDDLENEQVGKMLANWFHVVLFFSLRLLCANVIETVVLLDRALFIIENCPNVDVNLLPVFNPEISPRNFVLFGSRINN